LGLATQESAANRLHPSNQERVEVAANEALVSTALTLPPLRVTDALDAE
jgi:hypothetical protein